MTINETEDNSGGQFRQLELAFNTATSAGQDQHAAPANDPESLDPSPAAHLQNNENTTPDKPGDKTNDHIR